NLRGRRYYRPSDRGFEATIGERLAWRESLASVHPAPPVADNPPVPRQRGTPAPADVAYDPQQYAGEEAQIPEELSAPPPVRAPRRSRPS
ncbi:MAG: replication-associated recombination protein A, partial [Chloroflexia bacterium]|nr:replication-associated recombination protein A [Chloroflexia bacterium]